ncbi:DUF4125 family protein [Desulfobotulus sp. H1]|uniref:DUF4125 family protein n=1 Tax=Desulfobotulus pelophilus TaxID=2823377 RepID=A0ABT3NBM6_9BACT|nr:DUF4125 family protein [Desulfobotulus pelophilus]MCW7754866.1 DUF4125 family protein [Desulfobotulus pelophilus]
MISQRDQLIEEIIRIEMDMFRNVNSTITSPCQEYLKTFRAMRWMAHSVSPDDILFSCFHDLQEGVTEGRNFMREKYARMEGQIPPLKTSVLIDEIVDAECGWMEDVSSHYPDVFQPGGDGFRIYLSCELETFSDRTIEKIHHFTMAAKKAGRNLVEERYRNLFGKLGMPFRKKGGNRMPAE